MKNVLVTGAAEFIGYHFTSRLLNQGYRVTGLDNLNNYYDVNLKKARLNRLQELPDFCFVKADLADLEETARIFNVKNIRLSTYMISISGGEKLQCIKYQLLVRDMWV